MSIISVTSVCSQQERTYKTVLYDTTDMLTPIGRRTNFPKEDTAGAGGNHPTTSASARYLITKSHSKRGRCCLPQLQPLCMCNQLLGDVGRVGCQSHAGDSLLCEAVQTLMSEQRGNFSIVEMTHVASTLFLLSY